ncbi:MAG TPA: hypothetical protein PLX30_08910 [Methanothrix sp.]|nr:hypothetical protein [Methanothrix sp.]
MSPPRAEEPQASEEVTTIYRHSLPFGRLQEDGFLVAAFKVLFIALIALSFE